MTNTIETRSRQAFINLLQRQEQERTDLAAQLLAEEQEEATALRNAVNPQVGRALAVALEDLEERIRRDRKAGSLIAKVETSLPAWAATAFPPPDADDVAESRPRTILFVPRRFADGHQEHEAFVLADVSTAVFPLSSRR